ncbi:MAG: phospho-N-acetylmuramoyl-pentapeptide-transferase [Firmicutes bacterium]|nr:phospho-N-acetylmuramoyl-pentapeptide-transferase [Bacillota bacterium]
MTAVATWPVWAQAGAAALAAAAVVLLAAPRTAALLSALGSRQQIREDAPARHRAKAGVPTMGGLLIVAAVVVATAVAGGWTARVELGLAGLLGFGAIGFLDDLAKVRRGRNLGLRARERLALQLGLGLLLGGAAAATVGTALQLPGGVAIPLGSAYVVFAALWLAGFTNAVNLTDGLDGLAAGTVAGAMLAQGFLAYLFGHPEMAVFAGAVAGSCLGFLWFNAHPAAVFMGDTVSLALGGALAAVAILSRTTFFLPITGGIFVLEVVSVILQVIVFQTTGKRIFRMSPLHHHFELGGMGEEKVVTRFWLAGIAFGLLALFGAGPAFWG